MATVTRSGQTPVYGKGSIVESTGPEPGSGLCPCRGHDPQRHDGRDNCGARGRRRARSDIDPALAMPVVLGVLLNGATGQV